MYKRDSEDDWWNLGFIGGMIEENLTHKSLVKTVVTGKRVAVSGPKFINDILPMITQHDVQGLLSRLKP